MSDENKNVDQTFAELCRRIGLALVSHADMIEGNPELQVILRESKEGLADRARLRLALLQEAYSHFVPVFEDVIEAFVDKVNQPRRPLGSDEDGDDGKVTRISEREIPNDVLSLIPSDFVRRYQVVPTAKIGNLVYVCVARGQSLERVKRGLTLQGLSVELTEVDPADVDILIQRYYSDRVGPHTAHEVDALVDSTIGDDPELAKHITNIGTKPVSS